ncbi:hypothetical protein ACIF80_08940 [Streptomyces sp. NPDC085927]|uniref:hypothetical protein n=1 Tax=Streptomyces sp. NPDC085927 TaxID=3365738 RepID=UPI0037D4C338
MKGATDASRGPGRTTESTDPGGAIRTATPDDSLTLIQSLKAERQMAEGRRTGIEVVVGDDDTVRIRATAAPDTTVTTDRREWDTLSWACPGRARG